LRLVQWKNPLDALDLDDELAIDEQVDPVGASDAIAIEDDRQDALSLHDEPPPEQCPREAFLVRRLEQSGAAERLVHVDSAADYGLGEWVVILAHVPR
ncbi:MAG TPA: hypothetical protein VF761_01150, partial [Gemmatimonadaceae bacterium]